MLIQAKTSNRARRPITALIGHCFSHFCLQYDLQAAGEVQYAEVMKDLLDEDALALFLVIACQICRHRWTFGTLSQLPSWLKQLILATPPSRGVGFDSRPSQSGQNITQDRCIFNWSYDIGPWICQSADQMPYESILAGGEQAAGPSQSLKSRLLGEMYWWELDETLPTTNEPLQRCYC